MTVHKAKGLEFPVVILADITARLTPYEAGRYIDPSARLCALRIGGWSPKDLNDQRDDGARARASGRASASRTWRPRARAICSSCRRSATSRTPKGWIAPLNAAIYPAERCAARPDAARRLPGVHEQGLGARRVRTATRRRRCTVCPGEHRLRPARCDVLRRLVVGGRPTRCARRAGVVRPAARRSDRQGRAARRRRGWAPRRRTATWRHGTRCERSPRRADRSRRR